MDPVLNDERFAHVATDVRFRSVPKKEQKVKIDRRFESMFTGNNFKVKYSVDKRGRPNRYTTNENLKKYYHLSSSSASDASASEDSDDEKSAGKSKEKSKKLRAKPKAKEDSDSESEGEAVREERKFDVDYARGEGALETSSSEEDSSDSDEGEDQQEASGLIHPWGELDGGALKTDMFTRRLAVCNMDWDRIAARDLYVLLNSFTPPGGVIKTVKVYLSDFGRERLREEEVSGPKELMSEKSLRPEDEPVEDGQEGEKYHMEKLRQYQLNRLKYYYAVVECDSAATASKIYDECDGLEYESSAARLDLRYIPDDMEFYQEADSAADGSTNTGGYQPKNFTTTALQQAKVKLTWDETNPDRLQVIQRAFDKGEEENMDLAAYLASSDSEVEDLGSDVKVEKPSECGNGAEKEEESENEDGILKYKALLRDIEENENKKNEDDGDVHLEITWGTGLKEKAESLIKNRVAHEDITPWQQYLNQKKEKKRQKREEKKEKDQNVHEEDTPYSDDELPSDVDLDDPFFKQNTVEESAAKVSTKKIGKKKRKMKLEENEDTKQKNAELELLLMEEGPDLKHHYNLNKLLKGKTKTKSKEPEKEDKFQIDVEDPRFSAIFNSHAYNIDPSDPNFKRTEGMEMLIREKQKRKLKSEDASAANGPLAKREKPSENLSLESRFGESIEASGRPSRAVELSMLIKSVKNKACNFKRKNNKKVP